MILDIVSQTGSEPVTLEELKAYLRVDHDEEDSLITSLGVAARQAIETKIQKVIPTTTFDYSLAELPFGGGYYDRRVRANPTIYNWLPTHGGAPIVLPRAPLKSITSITYIDSSGDSQVVPTSVYQAIPSSNGPGMVKLRPNQVWPIPYPTYGAVTIRFVAGMGDDGTTVPDAIKTVIKMVVDDIYNHRSANSDVAMTANPAVKSLLAPYWTGLYV